MTKFNTVPELENIGVYMHFCQPTAILEWNKELEVVYADKKFKVNLPQYAQISWRSYQDLSTLLAQDDEGNQFTQLDLFYKMAPNGPYQPLLEHSCMNQHRTA